MSEQCPLGLKIGEALEQRYVAHGEPVEDDEQVTILDSHHGEYAVLAWRREGVG